MILSQKPVTIAEAKSYMKDIESKEEVTNYFKKFSSISLEDSNKMISELQALNNIKLREENFVKLVDFMPADAEELSKVLNEVSLTEEEAQAVLSIVKNYS